MSRERDLNTGPIHVELPETNGEELHDLPGVVFVWVRVAREQFGSIIVVCEIVGHHS